MDCPDNDDGGGDRLRPPGINPAGDPDPATSLSPAPSTRRSRREPKDHTATVSPNCGMPPLKEPESTHLGMRLPPPRRIACRRRRFFFARAVARAARRSPSSPQTRARPSSARRLKHHRNAEILRLSPRKISGFPAKIISTMPSNRSGRVSWQLLRRQSVPLERAGPRHQLAGRAHSRPRRVVPKVELRAPLVPETIATGTVVAGKRLLEEPPGPTKQSRGRCVPRRRALSKARNSENRCWLKRLKNFWENGHR